MDFYSSDTTFRHTALSFRESVVWFLLCQKEVAIEKNLPVFQPEKVKKNEEFINEIKSLNPDIICVVAYGKILPKEILEIPKYGCINVHGSLLPKYRGAAPIQWAVLNGDKETGVTTMYMDVGMDTESLKSTAPSV